MPIASSFTEDEELRLPSPCVGVCRLDANDYCMGCFRKIDEIREWPKADFNRQLAILNQLRVRRVSKGGRVRRSNTRRSASNLLDAGLESTPSNQAAQVAQSAQAARRGKASTNGGSNGSTHGGGGGGSSGRRPSGGRHGGDSRAPRR